MQGNKALVESIAPKYSQLLRIQKRVDPAAVTTGAAQAVRRPARVVPTPSTSDVQSALQRASQARRQQINTTYGAAAPRPRFSTSTPAPTPRTQPAPAAPSPDLPEGYVQLGLLKGQPGIPKYRYEAGTRASNLPLTKAGQPPKVGGQPYDPSLQTYGFAGGRPGTPAIQGPRGMVTRGGQQIEGGGLPVGPSPNLSFNEAVERGLVTSRTPSLIDVVRNPRVPAAAPVDPRAAAMATSLRGFNNPALVDAAQSFRVPRIGMVDPKAAAAVFAGAGLSAGPAWYFLTQGGGGGTNTSPTVDLTDTSPAAGAGATESDRARQEAAIRLQAEAEAARRAGLDPGNFSTGYGDAPPAPILPAPQGSVAGQPGSGQVVIRMNDGDSVLRQAAANAQAGAATFQPTAGSYQNARDYYAARAGYTAQPGVMSNVMERLVQQDPRMGQADMQEWARLHPELAYQMLQNSLPRGASQQTQNMQGAEITTELGTNTQNNMVGNTNEAVAAAQGASPDLKAATDPQLRVSLQPVPRDLQALYNRTRARFANASFR